MKRKLAAIADTPPARSNATASGPVLYFRIDFLWAPWNTFARGQNFLTRRFLGIGRLNIRHNRDVDLSARL